MFLQDFALRIIHTPFSQNIDFSEFVRCPQPFGNAMSNKLLSEFAHTSLNSIIDRYREGCFLFVLSISTSKRENYAFSHFFRKKNKYSETAKQRRLPLKPDNFI